MFPIDYNKIGLVYYPDKVLRTHCKEIDEKYFDTPELHELCEFMRDTANQYDGIGIAAPQIGLDIRLIYVAPTKKQQYFLINPEIKDASERKVLDSEGCLSLPHIYGTVIRPERVVVQAFNQYGERIEIQADKLLARVIQHEIDHINGELFIDKLVTLTGGREKLQELQDKAQENER